MILFGNTELMKLNMSIIRVICFVEFYTKISSSSYSNSQVVTSVTLSVEFVALELILIDELFDMIVEEIVQSERLIQTNRWFWVCLNIEFSKRIIMVFGSILTLFHVIIHSIRWNSSCATCKLAFWGVEVQIMTSLSKIQNSEKLDIPVTRV